MSWQKDFVHLIQSSGVLVVLSQVWIEELYHQVLERNLLAEAGYWGAPEDHALPLITMLTGKTPLAPRQSHHKMLENELNTSSFQISTVWAAAPSEVS